MLNYSHIILGIVAAMVYAIIGYAASDKPFDAKKFLRTFGIAVFAALGLDLGGMTFDVYTALVGPTALVVWLQKLIDSAEKSQK